MATQKSPEGEIVIDGSIDQILENLPIGSITRATGLNLFGINFRQTGNVVPRAKDSQGFVFFTRPQLNLNSMNVTNYRGFYNLLTSNPVSYQRFTRMMLDPRLGYGDRLKCPFVDNENPFFSILTNNIMSLSGWPDMTVPTHTSEAGLYGEEMSFVDGVTNHYESFDLDVTFKNTKGNPLIYLFYIWTKYQTLVAEGILNPYLDMITENEIDYNTRIYRVILDNQKRFVSHIAATGASFPLNVPTGNLFDFNTETPLMTRNTEINIRFRCLGFTAFEDILKLEFNKTNAIFNPQMANLLSYDLENQSDLDRARENPSVAYRVPGCSYVKLPHLLASTMEMSIMDNSFFSSNHRAYPYINLITNELEWWVNESKFKDTAEKNFKSQIESQGITYSNPEEFIDDEYEYEDPFTNEEDTGEA